MLAAALKAHCLAHIPLPFSDCITPGCLQGGTQPQQTAAAGATMEHPLTDLSSQAAPHLSATLVETASESDIVGIQEREGDIEEPGTPGGSKVSLSVPAGGGCEWEAGALLDTSSASSCLAGQGGQLRGEQHQLSGILVASSNLLEIQS